MNRRALILLGTGLLAALAAVVVVIALMSALRSTANTAALQQSVPTRTAAKTKSVVVATTDIAANSAMTTSMVTLASYPEDLVPADVFTDVNAVLEMTPKVPVFSGQMLMQRQFVATQGRTGASVNIPAGKVLAAFPSTDMLNATGAVQAGDKVDILLSIPISGTTRLDAAASSGSQVEGGRTLVAQATLQNIEVYTVGYWRPPGQQATQNQAENALKIITFVLDPQEALILKYIKDSGGTIDLVVRSAQDNSIAQTDPVTIDYLVDLYGFIGLADDRSSPAAQPTETPQP